ncbi:MAG TPA: LysR family transcriptional regulator [Elainellaceae cyanobacterium]
MELRHLRYFVAVAEELHFGRAAERLHIAQPPLSQQIRQLEEQLGFELFHRTKRSVKLTEAGRVFLDECQLVFRHLDQAIRAGQQASRGEIGKLVVGFVSSAAYSVLPPILNQFRNQFPGVDLTLKELTTDQQVQWLRDQRIDIGFVRPPVEDAELERVTILQEPLVVALPVGHALTQSPDISLRSLSSESFILFPRPLAPGLYDQIISLCQHGGFSPNVVQEAIQMQTIVSLVAAQMGVAIVPQSIQNLQRTGVVYQPFDAPTPKAAIALAWRRQDSSPTVQQFLEIVNRSSYR